MSGPSSQHPLDGDPHDDETWGPHEGSENQTQPLGPSPTAQSLRAAGRGVRAAGIVTGRGARFAFSQARKAARAEGADQTGLSRLIELSAVAAAGDAAVTISLANTVFFAHPGSSREPVALYLGMTILPFAVLAPLLGPFLDRFSHGRRWAIGGTLAIRGFLCWLLAGAVATNSITLYLYALGILVCSKAYGVARSATVPRLVPDNLTLVKANGRISLAAIIGAAVSAPLAGLTTLAGAQWSLRYAFVIFMGATVLAVLLPARSDSTHGEEDVSLSGRGKQQTRLPANVVFALRCNTGLRIQSGFLTIFMAFLLMNHPLPGWHDKRTLLLGIVVGAAGAGNTIGIALGSVLRKIQPRISVVFALLADAAAAVFAAMFFGLLPAVLFGLTAGLASSIGKLALDSTIQNDVAEHVRTSAFARSETLLQLSWVAGGFVGIIPFSSGSQGLWLLSAIMVGWIVYILIRPRMVAQQHARQLATAGQPFAGRPRSSARPREQGRPFE